MKTIAIAVMAVWMTASAFAATGAGMRFDSLFQDHAVLQRGQAIPVWGYGGRSGHRLQATLNGVSTWTKANRDGEFRFRFPAAEAGGPYVLEVRDLETDERISVSDVYVGEVWICAGQSNMEFPMKLAKPGFGEKDRPLVRMYTVARNPCEGRVRETSGGWKRATVGETDDFSAVGCFFGMRIQEELGCAVGLINASWGGTRIEPWMSRRALRTTEAGRRVLQSYYDGLSNPLYWGDPEESNRTCWPLDEGPGGQVAWAAPGADEMGWIDAELPGYFHDHYRRAFNGAVWYRKTVDIPADWAGRDLILRLPAADKMDVSYFNGKEIGHTGKRFETQWYETPRDYPISGADVKAGKAVVAVRVWSQVYSGGIVGDVAKLCLARKDGKGSIPLAGVWKSKIGKDVGLSPESPQLFLPGAPHAPGALFEGMIRPLVPYAVKGVIWYQGESNGSRRNLCDSYCEFAKAMVADWRAEWMQGDFPFVFTELAAYMPDHPFDPEEPWAVVRSAMRQVSLELPNVGLASALDLADASDFKEIHPPNKRPVGERLARWALATQYGRTDLAKTGPRFVRAEPVGGGKIRCYFTDVAKGLVAKGASDGSVGRVHVAGEDGKYFPAKAVIDGDTLLAWSPEVKRPVHVAYAWALNPIGANLCNSEGLPAATFRW